MKKIFCVLIAILLMLTSAFAALAADESVTAIGGSGCAGTLVDVRLITEGSEILDVTYDTDALLLYDIIDNDSENGNHGRVEGGAYRLSWTEGASENLVVLTFMIKPGTEEGSYAVTVKSGDVTKATANVLVTEEDIKDVNGDEDVDEDDATYIANHVVKKDGYAESISPKGDVNGDGVVNLLDAICLARSVEGLSGYQYGVERDENEPIPDIESDFGN